jgi:hypothetical protein
MANAGDGRRHEPAIAPPIETWHVGAVLRGLPPDPRGRYATDIHAITQTPAMIVRAAGDAAKAEHVSGTTHLVVTDQRQAPHRASQHVTGRSVGQGRS